MYIFHNAWKSITRNKGRNILICIVVFAIATSACVALSIREATVKAKEDTLSNLQITAQISFDRASKMNQMSSQSSQSDSSSSKPSQKFDMSQLYNESLTLDEYMKYTQALQDGDSYYYSSTASMDASGDLEPYKNTEEETTTQSTSQSSSQQPGGSQKGNASSGMGSQSGGKSFVAQGDFSLIGYSSYDAMMSLFGEDGSCSVTDGQMFDALSDEATCVISNELAMYNDLSVGDTITLANTNYADETYTLTICGIYTNSSSDSGNSMFSKIDPANNIYLSYSALESITKQSESAGNTYTSMGGTETSAAIKNEVNFTYVFSTEEHYNSFVTAVTDLGLSEDYKVSSQDLSAFESSITPLETLSRSAGWFFLVVLAIGAVVLIVLNIFNLRERKYEVGVLTAIGMKKRKVAMQFMCELLIVTFFAMLVGTAVGSAVSVPVTNSLLQNQIESTQSSNQQVNNNFGFSNQQSGTSNNASKAPAVNQNSRPGSTQHSVSYVSSVSSATDFTVILELFILGLFLTIISSLAAVVTIMRYDPLKILSDRS